jgi:uncharacterized protein
MRRKEKEITNRKDIDIILDEAEIIRVAMSVDNKPYIVCLNFGYDGKDIYFHSANEGQKLDMIKQNSNVCFQTEIGAKVVPSDTECDWTAKFKSVVGNGKAKIVEGLKDKQKGLDVIMDKYAPDKTFEYSDKVLKMVTLVKIEIDEIYGKKSKY